MPLPVAGIMSDLSYKEVSRRYTELERFAKELDSQLKAPFMTLSFMALLVIPEIKLSDKGLFDVSRFEFMDLFTWVERFNVQGSGLMNPNSLNPKELRLHRGGK